MEEEGKISSNQRFGETSESILAVATERGTSFLAEEEEEDDEDDDDEEEDVDDGNFKFEGKMNPLDFMEDDGSTIKLYEKLESLEYEAMAKKKRKVLEDHQREGSAKKARHDNVAGANFDEIMEAMNFGVRGKRRKPKKRGRQKGSKNKLSPEITRMLGDATLHYARGCYKEAISMLKKVVRIASTFPEPYHTLGLIYNAMGDHNKAMNCYMLAAHLMPKDSSLWKMLVSLSVEQGNTGQARYCLSKTITEDPDDITLRFLRASLHVELEEYQKVAESYF